MEEKNISAIRSFFRQGKWPFEEEDGVFFSGVPLRQDLGAALLQIVPDGIGITVLAELDRHLPKESLMELIQAANLLNALLPTGAMYIDLTERYAVFRIGALYPHVPAEAEDVAEQVSYALDMIECIADSLTHLGEDGWDAAKIVQTIMELWERLKA